MYNRIGIPFDFRIEPELHEAVKELSHKRDVSMADIIRTSVKEYLKKETGKCIK